MIHVQNSNMKSILYFFCSHEVKIADFKEYVKTLSADSDFKYAEHFEVSYWVFLPDFLLVYSFIAYVYFLL